MSQITDIRTRYQAGIITKKEYIDEMFVVHSVLFDYAGLIGSTDISSIEILEGEVLMTFRESGVRMSCGANDKRLATFDALNFGEYETAELGMQLKLMKKDSTVLDIGGNYGWYAIHVAKAHPQAHIHSFEPIPATYDYLVRNIQLNSVANIIPVRAGASENKGTFAFYYDPRMSANASMRNVSETTGAEEVICEVDTIDNYCRNQKLVVDFIKCDVEGAELLALKGAKTILESDRPIVFCEMLRKWSVKFGYHPNDIIDFLAGFGYNCFVLDSDRLKPFGRVNEETKETNYFFLHSGKHSESIRRHS